MTKILHVVSGMGYGGIARVIRNFYSCIDKDKYKFDFVVHGDEYDYHKTELSKCRFFYFNTIHKLGFKKYTKQLNDNIDIPQYDIVHIHIGTTSGLYTFLYKKAGAKKIIVHSHVNKGPLLQCLFLRNTLRFNSRLSDIRIACSKDAGDFCFGNTNFNILHNAIFLEKFLFNETLRNSIRSKLNLSDYFCIGNIGRFVKQKNQSYLIDIFHIYHHKNPQSKLILVGDGKLRAKIEYKINKMHLNDCVILLGAKDSVEYYYNALDCFLLPSLSEGLGIVAIEAQTNGLPCILSTNVPREAKQTDNVFFLKLKRKDLWVKKIIDIQKMNINRYDNYKKLTNGEYDIYHESKKLEDIYEKENEKYNS